MPGSHPVFTPSLAVPQSQILDVALLRLRFYSVSPAKSDKRSGRRLS